jgi:hypothetical protein
MFTTVTKSSLVTNSHVINSNVTLRSSTDTTAYLGGFMGGSGASADDLEKSPIIEKCSVRGGIVQAEDRYQQYRRVGGFVGTTYRGGTIRDSFSTATVIATAHQLE